MARPEFDLRASGARMREIRISRNITVKQVVAYMGFESVQAIYKWEAGKCFPQADNLMALARLYNVNPAELMIEEDRESSSVVLKGFILLF
jgi:transcriptional regulator with XRE-family HTH domain